MLDIDGLGAPEAIELEDEEHWTDWPADPSSTLLALLEAARREQNFPIAAAFADPVLELYAADQALYDNQSDYTG